MFYVWNNFRTHNLLINPWIETVTQNLNSFFVSTTSSLMYVYSRTFKLVSKSIEIMFFQALEQACQSLHYKF